MRHRTVFAFGAAILAAVACATSQEVPDCGAQTLCGAICVDPKSDPENCGTCGTACPSGQACVGGKCSTQCPAGDALCDRSCVNTKSDNTNCGSCGKKCKPSEVCFAGACGTTCGQKKLCQPDGGPAYCADTQSDNANCGSCGKACNPSESCVNGACNGSCSPDQTLCGTDGGGTSAYCANLSSDNSNCGDCGKKCGFFESCVAGACISSCTPQQKLCTPDGGMPYCADVLTDNVNCGTCGNTCPMNKPVCYGGMCTDGSLITALVCGAPSTPSWNTDVQTKLMATNAFSKVDVVQCNSSTPTLNQLQQYQSVLVFSDTSFANAATLGDNLADYVAGGGYAVVATFANASVLLGGKWISQGYNLINGSGQTQPSEASALQILDAQSPLVVGVTTLTATSGYKSTGGVVNGGTAVANWGSGAPLIVKGVKNGRNRAELNFYPPSSTVRNDFWAGDGAKIMKNALIYR